MINMIIIISSSSSSIIVIIILVVISISISISNPYKHIMTRYPPAYSIVYYSRV